MFQDLGRRKGLEGTPSGRAGGETIENMEAASGSVAWALLCPGAAAWPDMRPSLLSQDELPTGESVGLMVPRGAVVTLVWPISALHTLGCSNWVKGGHMT